MMNLLVNLCKMMIGFSSGVVIGAAFVALLTILTVIPRLIQIAQAEKLINIVTSALIFGALLGTYLSFTNTLNIDYLPHSLELVIGLLHGVFNGIVAAALVETLNVFPILLKRLRLEGKISTLLMALIFGKVAGSLVQWFYLTK